MPTPITTITKTITQMVLNSVSLTELAVKPLDPVWHEQEKS